MADLVFEIVALSAPPWPTIDPFPFCVHHIDDYPGRRFAVRPGRLAQRP